MIPHVSAVTQGPKTQFPSSGAGRTAEKSKVVHNFSGAQGALRARQRRWLLGMAGVTWAVVVAGGLLMLVRYQMTPGPAAAQARPLQWPGFGVMPLTPSNSRDTLVMFLHPQ